MKTKKILRLVLGFSLAVSLVSILWVCSIENIGPQEPSQIPIDEIVAELANANTQSDVAFAIDHLLDKTGVGRAIKGSRYNDYSFPDDFISDLAESHLRFLNDNDYALSWGDVFKIEQALPDDDWLLDVDFQEVVSRFQEQASAALLNPEDPNNALLLAIAADGSRIPNPIPLHDEDELDILSSVQDLLFTVWMNYEFQDFTGSLAKGQNTTVKIDIQEVECPEGKLVTKEKFETPEFNSENTALKKCHNDCKKEYKKAVKDCKKQFEKEKEGECKGGVIELTLKYTGVVSPDPTIRVEDSQAVYFTGTVSPGGTFTFDNGGAKFEKNNLDVLVNGVLNTTIHVSCSEPVGIGTTFGDFEVVGGKSKDGGTFGASGACETFSDCVDDLEDIVKDCVQDCHDQGFGG